MVKFNFFRGYKIEAMKLKVMSDGRRKAGYGRDIRSRVRLQAVCLVKHDQIIGSMACESTGIGKNALERQFKMRFERERERECNQEQVGDRMVRDTLC